MPIAYPVTLYGCAFKCGGRQSQNKKLIEKHEETCFANPARRACKTCKHDHKDPDPEECRCDHPDGDGLRPWGANGGLSPRADCPGWEPKKPAAPAQGEP